MKIAFFDCFSGASGDMILGALLDVGLPFDLLLEDLGKLKLDGYTIRAEKDEMNGIHGTRVDVFVEEGDKEHRPFKEIEAIIGASSLSPWVKERSIGVFRRLARAEARIHNLPEAEVTFHEIGAIDSIVDIVGSVIGFYRLGIEAVYASPLPLGRWFVETRHGVMPVPAPATLEVLKGVPLVEDSEEAELVTPTGAAILREMVEAFGPMPSMEVEEVGYGVGHIRLKERPNLLRVMIGRPLGAKRRLDHVIEANIDDMNPQFCEYLMEELFQEGALDVSFTPIHMKKNRPGLLLRVLAEPSTLHSLIRVILRESTSIGVRHYPVQRECLERRHIPVQTPWGEVRIKVSGMGGAVMNALPEYEDCKELARRCKRPIKEIHDEALAAYRRFYGGKGDPSR